MGNKNAQETSSQHAWFEEKQALQGHHLQQKQNNHSRDDD
jgi:hypothetical protein